LIVDFVFFLLVGNRGKLANPRVKHIRLLKSDNSVKARMPTLDYVGSRAVIQWIMITHVDSSDCGCMCIGKSIAGDLMLVARRLYNTRVTRPWTGHMQPCRYTDTQ